MILGARVLAEFGDDPNRYADAKSRKNYAGTSPITRASGKSHVVLARYARNRRLADACYLWAFAALTASPGARAFYDQHDEPTATPTTAPYEPSPTASSASSTAASDTTPSTTNTPPGHTAPPPPRVRVRGRGRSTQFGKRVVDHVDGDLVLVPVGG